MKLDFDLLAKLSLSKTFSFVEIDKKPPFILDLMHIDNDYNLIYNIRDKDVSK